MTNWVFWFSGLAAGIVRVFVCLIFIFRFCCASRFITEYFIIFSSRAASGLQKRNLIKFFKESVCFGAFLAHCLVQYKTTSRRLYG